MLGDRQSSAKAGMAHSICGCTYVWVAGNSVWSLAIHEHLRGESDSVQCYTNVLFTVFYHMTQCGKIHLASHEQCQYLISGNTRCQSTFHHPPQRLLFAFGLTCQLGTAVTKPRYVVLITRTQQNTGYSAASITLHYNTTLWSDLQCNFKQTVK